MQILMVFFISVEPPGFTDKIFRALFSFEVKSWPNCLGMSRNPSTERPERQLHS